MTLANYIKQTKSDLADIGSRLVFGKTCEEVVADIIKGVDGKMVKDKPGRKHHKHKRH